MTGKEKIIASAIKLFAEEGFENTSIQRLATVSEVAQGLLYRHFKSKNDLLLHLLHLGFAQIACTLEPYRNPVLTFEEAFTGHIQLCVELLSTNQQLWKTLHTVRHNTDLMSQLGIKIDFEKEVIKPINAKLAKGGYKNTHTLAWALVSMIDGITAMYLLHPQQFPLKKIEKLLIENIYGTLK